MKQTSKQSLGQKGEQRAREFLLSRGLKIIKCNYRSGHGEIDIIALDEDALVFVEVKSFKADPLAAAEFRINKSKKNSLIRTAYAFLEEFPEFEGHPVRFDAIVVDFSDYPATVTHHSAAFWLDNPFYDE